MHYSLYDAFTLFVFSVSPQFVDCLFLAVHGDEAVLLLKMQKQTRILTLLDSTLIAFVSWCVISEQVVLSGAFLPIVIH